MNKLCSTQHLPRPFDCGKPLNNTLWQLLGKEEFDLPGLQTNLIKTIIVFVAAIILSMAKFRVSIHSKLLNP